MDNSEKLQFKISAALKNLIGKELITDQYVAIFELVKNSFDAHAREVTIIFENIYKSDPKVIIKDNGKGMDYDDLVNKWLFVAYSAKRDGTEDAEIEDTNIEPSDDYRNRIKTKRIYAGAKGVGRFSCDRLGSELNLITIKDKEGSLIENLEVSWEDFEKDSKEEFVNIDVKYKRIDENKYSIKHGTILEISGLRDAWDRDKLLKLKRSLEKLINPNQENGGDDFSIKIVAEEELKEDNKESEERDKINGNVKNTIFEKLNIKTTQIVTEISDDGSVITTTLTDRGKLIYKIKEKNPYAINNIKIHLFNLNRSAKNNFYRLMGMHSVEYGSIFVYKNGFRIYPLGEEGEDFVAIDRRKAQGYNRYLGTRDLIGRVEINGSNEGFKETTSRDGGLFKNESYYELEKFFMDKALKRLEKYVVDIIRWGEPYKFNDDDKEHQPALNPEDVKQEIRGAIERLASSKDFIEFEYREDFLDIIEESQQRSVVGTLKDISKHAIETDNSKLLENANKIGREVKELIEAKNEAEKEVQEKAVALKEVSEILEQKTKQNLFLKSVTSLDFDNVVSLHHQIGIYANDIDAQLLICSRKLNRGALLSTDDIRSLVDKVGFLNKKILSIARFATKANFSLQTEEIEADLVSFVKQYIENIYSTFTDNNINITFDTQINDVFVLRFKPIEITIIVDNLINNSRKANARNIDISIHHNLPTCLILKFKDDGNGLNKSIKNKDEIFEKGFTTTLGSGLGLYHVSQILKEMKGHISVNTDVEKGIEFILEVYK